MTGAGPAAAPCRGVDLLAAGQRRLARRRGGQTQQPGGGSALQWARLQRPVQGRGTPSSVSSTRGGGSKGSARRRRLQRRRAAGRSRPRPRRWQSTHRVDGRTPRIAAGRGATPFDRGTQHGGGLAQSLRRRPAPRSRQQCEQAMAPRERSSPGPGCAAGCRAAGAAPVNAGS